MIKEKYDAILVIVDRFTKYCYIILFKEKYIIEKREIIILNKLIWYYKILKKITRNRGKL